MGHTVKKTIVHKPRILFFLLLFRQFILVHDLVRDHITFTDTFLACVFRHHLFQYHSRHKQRSRHWNSFRKLERPKVKIVHKISRGHITHGRHTDPGHNFLLAGSKTGVPQIQNHLSVCQVVYADILYYRISPLTTLLLYSVSSPYRTLSPSIKSTPSVPSGDSLLFTRRLTSIPHWSSKILKEHSDINVQI